MVAAEEFDAERNLLKDDLYYLYETPE